MQARGIGVMGLRGWAGEGRDEGTVCRDAGERKRARRLAWEKEWFPALTLRCDPLYALRLVDLQHSSWFAYQPPSTVRLSRAQLLPEVRRHSVSRTVSRSALAATLVRSI